MTGYAVNGNHVVAIWETGGLDRWASVVDAATDVPEQKVEALTVALQQLSCAIWDTFAKSPVEVAGADVWYVDEIAGREDVLAAITAPNVTDDFGVTKTCDTVIVEAAHTLGRAVIGHPRLRAAVLTEVEAELSAVQRAECGDFSGRAAQAVGLPSSSVSPTQMVAAHDLLKRRAIEDLYTTVEAPAACAAVVVWLRAAARYAAEEAGADVDEICEIAEDLDDLDLPAVAEVLAGDPGTDPATVVLEFISHDGDADLWFMPHDLLEQLISGLWACALVAGEHSVSPAGTDLLEELLCAVEDDADAAFAATV